MSEITVKVHHIRKAGLCMRGARMWFAQHDLDFGAFMKTGLPISQLEQVGDALADLVCTEAREEAEENGQ